MEVEIQYSSRPGLRIVPNFIEGKLVWVRGFNGIGKTLAATMLEIASGSHEFDRKSEFESLRSALKFVDLFITIDKKKEFSVKLTPEKWEFIEETNKINDLTLGIFLLEDKEITPREFQGLFQVKIVKGNETLSTQIQEMTRKNIAIARDLEEQAKHSQLMYEQFIRQVSSKLHIGSLEVLKEKMSNLDILENQVSDLKSQMTEFDTIIQKIVDLKRIDGEITLREEYTEGKLQNNLKHHSDQLHVLERRMESLTDRRDILRNQIREEIVRRKQAYDSLIRRYGTLESRIQEAKIDLARDLQGLDISIRPIEVETAKIKFIVEGKQAESRDEESKCRKQKKDIILKRMVHETADNVRRDLVYEEEEVRDEVIAEGYIEAISQSIKISVGELRDLITNRILTIQKSLESSDVGALDDRLRELHHSRMVSESILKNCTKLENNIHELDLMKKRIKHFEMGGSDSAQSASRSIDKLEREIENTVLQIHTTRSQIQEIEEKIIQIEQMPSLGSLSKERLRLFNLVSNYLGIDETTRINDRFVKGQKEKTRKIEYRLVEMETNLDDLRREISLINRTIERAIGDLSSDVQLNFLLKGIDENEPPARKLELIRDRLRAFIEYMDKEVTQKIEDIRITLEEMLQFQRGQESVEQYRSPQTGKALEEIFNGEFLRNYGKPEYMRHVFAGFERIVSFDLKNNEISLIDKDGETVTRPISAFSSGEKAFAFALAMISLFGQEVASYKVLFLDEFGALLDFVKETALLDELKKEVFSEGKIDKVVILLPVKENVEKQISELRRTLEFFDGEERARIQARIKELSIRAESLEKFGFYQYETPVS